MKRWQCGSKLSISSSETHGRVKITIRLTHNAPHLDEQNNHIPYYDVSLPGGAAAIIRENLEWSSPSDLVSQVQLVFPQVTGKQIHHAWRQMSQEIWRRSDDPVDSAHQLLWEYQQQSGEAHLLDVEVPEGVEILAFCFPRVFDALQNDDQKIEEIGMDATCMCLDCQFVFRN